MTYRLTLQAETDLEGILDFIALRDGETRAESVLDSFAAAFEHLAASPLVGRVRANLTGSELRWWPVRRWLILYEPSLPITVMRIVHGARDIDRTITGWFGRTDDD